MGIGELIKEMGIINEKYSYSRGAVQHDGVVQYDNGEMKCVRANRNIFNTIHIKAFKTGRVIEKLMKKYYVKKFSDRHCVLYSDLGDIEIDSYTGMVQLIPSRSERVVELIGSDPIPLVKYNYGTAFYIKDILSYYTLMDNKILVEQLINGYILN